MNRVWAFTECVRSPIAQWAVALGLVSAAMGAGMSATAQEAVDWGVEEVGSGNGREWGSDASVASSPNHAITPLFQADLEQPATTIEEWFAQIEASLTQITEVRVEETEAGLQIVLETSEGELANPTTQTVGNALIAEIPNAVLALPGDDAFEQFGPAEGIALVSVTNEPGVGGASPAENRVRVAITAYISPFRLTHGN